MKRKTAERLLAGALVLTLGWPSAVMASENAGESVQAESSQYAEISGSAIVAAGTTSTAVTGKTSVGWKKIGGTWYYITSDGSYATGLLEVKGKWYYFYEDGSMAVSTWIDDCYVNSDGAWVKSGQWIKSGSRWWYRNVDGSYTKSNWQTIDGVRYYFDGSGWMVTGWLQLGGTWYYFAGNGANQTGWQQIKQKWYYFNEDGSMAASTWIDDCYVNRDGAWVERGQWIKSGSRWWYRNVDGSYIQSDWQTIDGERYYFDEDGWMLSGWLQLEDDWYYLDGSGALCIDWVKLKDIWYYLDGENQGRMVKDWNLINDVWYYFDENGGMAENTWIGTDYVDETGACIYSLTEEEGWVQLGTRWVYNNGDGTLAKAAWKTIKDAEYYFDEDGWMVTGWLLQNGSWYYLKDSGAKAYSYWVGTQGTGGYYIGSDGIMLSSTTCNLNGVTYTFNASGKCTGTSAEYVVVSENGKSYKLEPEYLTDPRVGVDITEDELLAAAVYAEAGNQGMPGMTGVALVMLNRMESSYYPCRADYMIYQRMQFAVARDGSLTRWLNDINNSILNNAKAAVKAARQIMNAYKTNGTPRTVDGLTMPDGKTDFDYLGFMAPWAFEDCNLDWEKTDAFTYKNTTFYTKWITK